MVTRIIYIPGLGDHFDSWRQWALRRWNSDDIRVSFVPMKWHAGDDESYSEKFERIATVAREAHARNERVVVMGESAGGAMALYAFSQAGDVIDRVVTLCGYNHGAPQLSPRYQSTQPAFFQLMPKVDQIVENLSEPQRQQITTFYSTHDHVVRPYRTLIDGTKVVERKTPGHLFSIAWLLITKRPLKY